MKTPLVAALAVGLAAPLSFGADKVKKPSLDIRVTPRMAFSPVNILVIAELKGGNDIEEYYCPEIEWDWDDGGKSTHEADCAPYEAGTKIERRFTGEHQYDRAGVYNVKATFKRTGRSFAADSVRVTVRAGLGDPTQEIN